MGEPVDVCIEWWGSFGQYARDIAILKDGTVIDPREVGVWRGKRLKCATVDKDDVVAIVRDSKSSTQWKGFRVKEGSGEIDVERKIEKWVEGNKEFMQSLDEYYYVDKEKGLKVLLKRIYGSKMYRLIGKPKLKVIKLPEGLCIKGDTFPIKESIKRLGGKWFADKSCWLFKKIPAELFEIADVEYSPDVPPEQRTVVPSERVEALKKTINV